MAETVDSKLRAGALSSALESAYRRLGPRYVRRAIAAVPQIAIANVVLGIAILSLFIDMSAREFLLIAGVGVAGMFAYNLLYTRVALERIRPVLTWVEGKRDRAATLAAWKTCAKFPYEMMRRDWLSPTLGSASYIGLLLWTAFVTWQLALPALTTIPLFAGIMVLVLYVQALRFFMLERVLRPVLDEIATAAADAVDLYEPGLPLRSRLLAALPAMNVITAVFAVAVTGIGHNLGLADLGLAVLVSLVLAATVSLAVTLLLANSVTSPIGALCEATERVGRGDFAARVPVVTTDETGLLARSFNQMAAGLEQRERLRDAFGTFVDPSLAERVARDGTDLHGEEVEVSILFMDVRGFTSFSERAPATEVVARLNDLYGLVVPVILEHGGHANKFIGDGLLAVFGAPERHHDHADRAAAAALEIARCVRDRYGESLRVGLGVNSGTVVVGTIGGGGRLDFTVIGDAVNTASRVESATRATGDDVLITEETHRRLGRDLGTWEQRPAIPLKGKREEIRLLAPPPL